MTEDQKNRLIQIVAKQYAADCTANGWTYRQPYKASIKDKTVGLQVEEHFEVRYTLVDGKLVLNAIDRERIKYLDFLKSVREAQKRAQEAT